MEFIVVCIAAAITSGLTLFSGFGLGTILMPVFALFFSVEIAIALAAIVHLLNNLFKFILLGKHADKNIVIQFGLPAILAALSGAQVLIWLSDLKLVFSYQLMSGSYQVMLVKLIIAVLIAVFSIIELLPQFEKISFQKKYLPLGGILSGFFGGLSGHQGAFRSMFLIRSGLTKEGFIATGVAIAILVDIIRISVYFPLFLKASIADNILILFAATLSAFLGAFMGSRLIKKVTMRTVQVIVLVMLLAIAIGLGLGLI